MSQQSDIPNIEEPIQGLVPFWEKTHDKQAAFRRHFRWHKHLDSLAISSDSKKLLLLVLSIFDDND